MYSPFAIKMSRFNFYKVPGNFLQPGFTLPECFQKFVCAPGLLTTTVFFSVTFITKTPRCFNVAEGEKLKRNVSLI